MPITRGWAMEKAAIRSERALERGLADVFALRAVRLQHVDARAAEARLRVVDIGIDLGRELLAVDGVHEVLAREVAAGLLQHRADDLGRAPQRPADVVALAPVHPGPRLLVGRIDGVGVR